MLKNPRTPEKTHCSAQPQHLPGRAAGKVPRLGILAPALSGVLGKAHLILLSCALLVSACAPDQLIVVIDTDAVAFDQLASATEKSPGDIATPFSPAAVIDTVRIDVLDADGRPVDVCELGGLTARQWPLSFGIERGDKLRYIRVRGFQKAFSTPAPAQGLSQLCGNKLRPDADAVLSEPPPEVTIERMVLIPPIDGVQRRSLVLSLSCIGAAASFLTHTSCIGGADLPPAHADFAAPQQWDARDGQDGTNSQIGSSPFAVERPCTAAAPTGPLIERAICIPGGLSIQGDLALVDSETGLMSSPLRVVYLSPFYMDQDEVAVRRYQKLIEAAKLKNQALPAPHAGTDYALPDSFEVNNCTWQLPFANRDLPVNCIHLSAARAACRLAGGELPSEAQWEHAARGHGDGRRFPWGSAAPERSELCCVSALRRLPLSAGQGPNPDQPDRCGEHGPAPVGSFRSDRCPDGGDETAEGVRDIAGNVSEYVVDDFRPYSELCGLGYGLTRDPVCVNSFISHQLVRGGHFFTFVTDYARSARRWLATPHLGKNGEADLPGSDVGFRCQYKGE